MRLYTVHLRRGADPLFTPDLGAVFVREGFNWWAFIFTWIWALACGLWIPAAILFAADLVVILGMEAIRLEDGSQWFVTLGFHVIVGFVAEDLRRWHLGMLGYAVADVVAGETESAAERRFFEHHPTMAKPAWR